MENAIVALVSLAAIIAATALALKVWPRLLAFVSVDPRGRNAALDGLRGILALGVLIHHGFIMRGYRAGEPWGPPAGHLENLLGVGSVALFFMASAYLFWGRVLAARDRFDWLRYIRGRVMRIFPMYLATVALLFVVVAFETGFALHEPAAAVVAEASSWLTFNFRPLRDINGLKDTYTILSVLWSLRFEWILYIALPAAALIYWRSGAAILIYGAILALSWRGGGLFYLAAFAAGGFASHILAWRREDRRIDALFAIAGLCAIPTLIYFYRFVDGYVQTGLLLLIFIAALRPWGVWRWLAAAPMLYLGQISFSIYLLHNPLLHLATAHVIAPSTYAALPAWQFILVDVCVGLVVVAVATVTFRFVEKPFIDRAARPLPWPTAGWPAWLQPNAGWRRQRHATAAVGANAPDLQGRLFRKSTPGAIIVTPDNENHPAASGQSGKKRLGA